MQEADEQSEGKKKKKPVRGAQEESWRAAREGARALVWFILICMPVYFDTISYMLGVIPCF